MSLGLRVAVQRAALALWQRYPHSSARFFHATPALAKDRIFAEVNGKVYRLTFDDDHEGVLEMDIVDKLVQKNVVSADVDPALVTVFHTKDEKKRSMATNGSYPKLQGADFAVPKNWYRVDIGTKLLSDDLSYFVEWNERHSGLKLQTSGQIPSNSEMLILNRDTAVKEAVDAVQNLVDVYNTGIPSRRKEKYPLFDAIMGSGLGKTTMGPFLCDHLRRKFEGDMPVKFLFLNFNGDNNEDTLMDEEFFLVKEADPEKQTKAEYSKDPARMALRLLGAITGTPAYDFLKAHEGQYKLYLTVKHVFRFARELWGVPDKKPVMVFVHMDEIQKLDQALKTATDDDPLVEFRKVRSPLTDFLFDNASSRALAMDVIPVLMVSGLTADKVTAGEFSHCLLKRPVPLPRLREEDFATLLKWELRNKRKVEVDDAAFDKLLGRADVQQLVRDCAGHPRLIQLALDEFDTAWLEDINFGAVMDWSTRTLDVFKAYYLTLDDAAVFIKQFGDPELLLRVLVSGVKINASAWHVQWDKCGIVWRTQEHPGMRRFRINAPFFTLRALSTAVGPRALPVWLGDLFGARLWNWQDFERAELHIDALRTAELRAGETEEKRVCTVGELYAGAIWSKGSDGAEWKVGLPEEMVVKEEDKQVFAGSYDFEAMVGEDKVLLYKQMRQCAAGNPGVDSWTLRKSADGRPDVICLKQSKHPDVQKCTTIDKGALQEMVAKMTRAAAAKVASYRRVLLIFTNRGVADDAVAWLQRECDEGADVCVGLICARNLAEYVPPVMLGRACHADDRSGDVWVE